MEDPFHTYLYNLALVAVTFAGFATLATSLREGTGKKLSRFEVLLIQNHFILGFAVVGSAFLPPLLSFAPFFDKPSGAALRLASVLASLPPLIFSVTYPRVRAEAAGQPMPIGTKKLLACYCLIAVCMLSNLYVDEPALYAFVLTAQQAINIVTFLYGLKLAAPKN